MNGVLKGLLCVLVLIYVIFPVDLCPGPIDDIILCLMCAVGNRTLLRSEN